MTTIAEKHYNLKSEKSVQAMGSTSLENINISIVIPVYYNEGSLMVLYDQLVEKVIKKNEDKTFEIIFIDDGSGDNSLNELIDIRSTNPELVKIIEFSRNFGQDNATYAGYTYAKGECVINISADLQDPPELINDMLKYHQEEGYEIVVCNRESREESLFRRITSKIAYWIVKKLNFPEMPIGGFDFVLISKKVKELIINNLEANPFFQGQILWTGYKSKFIPYKRKKRKVGTSRWSFSMKLKILIDSVLAYSYFPLRLMSVFGIFVAFLGFLYALEIIISKLVGVNVPFEGWAPIIVLILVLSGFQMLMLGVIGEYLWRTLDQVRKRPPYIIDKVYE